MSGHIKGWPWVVVKIHRNLYCRLHIVNPFESNIVLLVIEYFQILFNWMILLMNVHYTVYFCKYQESIITLEY